MATMLPSKITEICGSLQLPGATFSQVITDGLATARIPHKTLLDCPHNIAPDYRDRHTRKLRVVWRVGFRDGRESLRARDHAQRLAGDGKAREAGFGMSGMI